MSVLAANGGQMRDYKVPAEIPQAGPPIVAIPTTAGTGSEVTRFTVITDTETDEKMLIAGLACCPLAAIVDYELDPDDAAAADRRYRARQPDACDRGLCQPPRQSVHRRPRQECDGADRPPYPHGLRRARQPGGARGDDARRHHRRDGVLERQRLRWCTA